MAILILIALIALCVGIITWGLKQGGKIYEFPFLAAFVYLGWVIPQLIGLLHNHMFLPLYGLEKTAFMTILCLLMIFVGYLHGKTRTPSFERPAATYSERKILAISTLLSMIGMFFYWKVVNYDHDLIVRMSGGWTGEITIYAFFTRLAGYGLVLAMLCLWSQFSWYALMVVAFDSIIYLSMIIIGGRRAYAIEFVLIVLLSIWFTKGVKLPRWTVLLLLLTGMLLVNNIGHYRAATGARELPSISDVASINYYENLKSIYYGETGMQEMKNALYDIAATDEGHGFDYGLALWNMLVHHYVPAQLVGYELKQRMQFKTAEDATWLYGHVRWIGSTATGFSDSFKSFWYFGALLFFPLSLFLGRLYASSTHGDAFSQALAIVCTTPALHSITHGVYWSVTTMLSAVLIISMSYWVAREPSAG